MRILIIFFLASTFTFSFAIRERVKNYEKERICQQFYASGKDKFREFFIALYSQKFPNGTFEEVTCVANEMIKLAERCCSEDASPECYNEGATAMSQISCGKDSPFPKHPGIGRCCAKQELERKLCLAALRYSAEELPSLLEPSHEEICQQYKQEASAYSARYVYEFARRHRSSPAGLVLNATSNHLQMAEKCCSQSSFNPCFFRERLRQREFNIFLRFTSSVCNNQVNLKSHKTGLAVYYGSLLELSFENALAVASNLHEGLTKCCLDPQPDCIIQEFTEFQKILCNVSTQVTKLQDFQRCCKKSPQEGLTCMDEWKRPAHQLPETKPTPSPNLCSKASQSTIERYLFEMGMKHPSISVPVFVTLSDHFKYIVESCCVSADVDACMEQKRSKLKEITSLISKTDGVCSKYNDLDFPAFKTMTLEEIQKEQPKASKEEADTRAKAFVDFGSTCCFRYAPAVQCQKLTEALITGGKDDPEV